MKILHCADLHIDSKMNTNFDSNKAEIRRNEVLYNFKRMAEYARNHEIETIMIAGDLFDTGIIHFSSLEFILETIQNYGEINFFYLFGNHDAEFLSNIQHRLPDNLYLFEDTWTYYDISKKVTISGILTKKYNDSSLYDTLELEKDRINLVLLHGMIEPVQSKNDYSISIKGLKNKNIDYLALGHIHTNSEGMIDARGHYVNPGCLEGRGFDEMGEHGFVVLHIEESSYEIQWEFVPFAKRKIFAVNLNVNGSGDANDIFDRTSHCLIQNQIRHGDIVRIQVCGSCAIGYGVIQKLIQERYGKDFFYLDVENQTSITVDYSKYMYDHTLKGEFIRTVYQDKELSEQEKIQIITCGIERLGGVV